MDNMGDNERKERMEVAIKGSPGLADPSPGVSFIFALLCFVFWLSMTGRLDDGANLTMGSIQVACFVFYTISAVIYFKQGLAVAGNTYVVFATCFGGIGGFTNIASYIANLNGLPFDTKATGVVNLLAGLFLLMQLFSMLYTADKVTFGIYVTAGLALTGSGLIVLGLLPMGLMPLCGWGLFMTGILGSYGIAAAMYGFNGYKFPMGKPFLKKKELERAL